MIPLALVTLLDLFLWTLGLFAALVVIAGTWEVLKRPIGTRRANLPPAPPVLTPLGGSRTPKPRKAPPPVPQLKISARDEADCPFCLSAVSEDRVVCGCGAVFHRECIAEMGRGRCSTLGCDKRVA